MSALWLQLEILIPAFLAGLIVLASHVPLGQRVLAKGIVFFDLAIAQIAAVGFVAYSLWLPDAPVWQAYGFATLLAMLGATSLFVLRHISVVLQEALIGSLFMLASTGVVLLVAKDPHGGEKIKSVMNGQILWVTGTDLLYLAIATAILPGLWWLLKRLHQEFAFYPVFAIAVTVSTQLIGVYLVFASLILPALATREHNTPYKAAFAIGALGYALGLIGSAKFDLPSGAAISWSMAFCSVGFLLWQWFSGLRKTP